MLLNLHSLNLMNSFGPLIYVTAIFATLLILYVASVVDSKKNRKASPDLSRQTDTKYSKQEKGDRHPRKKYSTNWWTDPKVFELERRAILSTEWFFVTHVSRFKKVGDYRTFEVAGFSFIVILGKDAKIRAFHNVCRHRAYAVTKKEVGSSAVLGCRYHGWSYDTKGKLIKAPEFDTVEGFEKEANSLWEVKTQIQESMVFINLDNGIETAALNLHGAGRLLKKWGVSKMSPISDWKIEGLFNWKLSDSLLNTHTVQVRPSEREWWPAWMWDGRKEFQILRTTLVRQHSSEMVLFMRVVPKSSTVTTVECSLFTSSSNETRVTAEDIRKEIALEVDALVAEQRKLLCGQAPLLKCLESNQESISRILTAHAEAENKAGQEIHPAARSQSFTLSGKADDDCE